MTVGANAPSSPLSSNPQRRMPDPAHVFTGGCVRMPGAQFRPTPSLLLSAGE